MTTVSRDVGDFWVGFTKDKFKVVVKSIRDTFLYSGYLPKIILDSNKREFFQNAAKPIGTAAKIFSIQEFIENVNTLRHDVLNFDGGLQSYAHRISVTVSDTVGSMASIVDFAVSSKIVELSAVTMSWLPFVSGATIIYSFGDKIISQIKGDVIKGNKNVQFYEIWKRIATFALGIVLLIGSYIGFASLSPVLLCLSTVSIVCEILKYYHNKSPDPSPLPASAEIAAAV